MPAHHRQTNKLPDIYAYIIALKRFTMCNVIIITGPEHIFVRTKGRAQVWRDTGWSGKSGPIYNDKGSLRWILVPAPQEAEGNEVANR